MIYRFDSLSSTNDEAMLDTYAHGDVIVAERQSAGRGQRGHKWLSGEGLNLTLSAIVKPTGVDVRNQFLISQAVALAMCDMLSIYGIDARIKWTNDIYVGDRKIVGILIENRLTRGALERSVVGIGINVNQSEFDPELPNPTSMALVAKREFDRDEILRELSQALFARIENLLNGESDLIVKEYCEKLYRLGELHTFRLASGETMIGKIMGVEPSGELLVHWDSGQRGAYLFGEIDFVIESRKR